MHKSVQEHIYNLLPHGEAFIEHRLSNHIADLAWLPQKIIFEIQVSPISIDTAVARTFDYKKMGFNLVWILHQKSFNGTYLSLAELFLRRQPNCYFTNITTTSTGSVYNQTEQIRNNKREGRGALSPIDLTKPIFKNKKLYFNGDLNKKNLLIKLMRCLNNFYSYSQFD